MPPTSRLSRLATALLLVAPATLVAAPASAAADGITGVRGATLGGGYSPYLFFGCGGVEVSLQDATPSATEDYAVTVGGRAAATLFSQDADGGVTLVALCPQDLVDGETYDVAVTEAGEPLGAAFAWRYDVVTMPTGADAPTGDVAPGELVVPLDGDVEPGAQVTVKTVANKGGTRPEAVQNNPTEFDVPTTFDAAAGALVLQVPQAAAGRFLWISMTGELAGQVTGGLVLAPLRVAAPQPYDASSIENVGTKQGRAVVGRTVSISAPRFSSTEAADATTVRYRWLSGGRALPATRRSLTVTRTMAGKPLAVRVTFSSDGTAPLVRTVGFGTVRR